MVGCAAKDCLNRTEKGFKMYMYPAENERREIWIRNSGRELTLSRNAKLCEVHFEPDQFVTATSGERRRLKPDAVPTVFAQTKVKKLKIKLSRSKETKNDTSFSIKPTKLKIKLNFKKDTKKKLKKSKKHAADELKNLIKEAKNVEKKINEQEILKKETKRNKNTSEISLGSNHSRSKKELENTIKGLEIELNVLKRHNEILEQNLRKVFSQEQIDSLKTEEVENMKWNEETILKAIKVRFALGNHGYNHLKNLGYPIPSCSTLNRKIEDWKAHDDIIVIDEMQNDCDEMDPLHIP